MLAKKQCIGIANILTETKLYYPNLAAIHVSLIIFRFFKFLPFHVLKLGLICNCDMPLLMMGLISLVDEI